MALAAPTATASAWPGSSRRHHLLQFLLHTSKRLDLRPIVKYAALAFFEGRLLPALPRKMGFCGAPSGRSVRSWLLEPLRDSNLEFFALVAVWIASKIHEMRPLSVKSLKALSDRIIADQHFTCRDFADAELVFMEVVDYNIGSSNIAFTYLEELLIHFREISKVGDLVNMDVCMDILDILYETEDSAWLYNSPCPLAASTLVTAYVMSVPKQTWEFPILPWVTFTTSYDEQDIMKIVLTILMHVIKPDEVKEKDTRGMIDNLIDKTFAWEDGSNMPFLYDGVRLVAILEEQKLRRVQKEEDKRRYRVQIIPRPIFSLAFHPVFGLC